jgi:hypothetical protein
VTELRNKVVICHNTPFDRRGLQCLGKGVLSKKDKFLMNAVKERQTGTRRKYGNKTVFCFNGEGPECTKTLGKT